MDSYTASNSSICEKDGATGLGFADDPSPSPSRTPKRQQAPAMRPLSYPTTPSGAFTLPRAKALGPGGGTATANSSVAYAIAT